MKWTRLIWLWFIGVLVFGLWLFIRALTGTLFTLVSLRSLRKSNLITLGGYHV